MLEQLLGGLIDKEKATYDTIQETLKDVAEELKCSPKDFIIAIKATDDNCNFKCHIMRATEKGNVWVREITLKEIIS